ncbi:NAD(P)H-hydrate dehydratase [Lapidilactobacillus bayanensis]|uniref:NAD(P)H-hydrate dehydratase n=1 Tax=Lapidilactobacillus bayanensis TaxID=2485998 RepID=UPI000F76CADE|nr:NAD(P)H-hydrate dehydratase [Lapidilactobacillus bayanensis]
MIELTDQILTQVITPRQPETHKGNYGRVLVIGGAKLYGGAGILSASAALLTGAGLITLASDAVNRNALHARHPEIMFLDWADTATLLDLIKQGDVIVIGPGLGLDATAQDLLNLTLSHVHAMQTLIVDGSALTLIAEQQIDLDCPAQIILTPHQEEWHHLAKIEIAKQTPATNQKVLAEKFPATTILVLKQHRTEIYANGEIYQNTSGTAAMATGGMGDTLTGILAALIAQFKAPLSATLAGVYLHGLAGQLIGEEQYVALPSDLIEQVSGLMKKYSEITEQQSKVGFIN